MCCVNINKTMKNQVKATTTMKKHKLQKKQRSSRKAVSFGNAQVVGTVDSRNSMPMQERNQIWYPVNELSEFRQEARDMCRDLKNDASQSRGLEFRISKERQQQRALTISITLKAQGHYGTVEDVAKISEKCSARAKHMALTTGQLDFYQAYFPDAVDTNDIIKATNTTLPAFPVSAVQRRN